MCVSACSVAAFIVGNVSGQTPHPYEAPLAIFAAFGFLALFALALLRPAFAGFFAAGSFFAFAGFSAFGFGSRFGSVPSTHQNRQPLQATPPIAAFPADDGLLCSVPSSSR